MTVKGHKAKGYRPAYYLRLWWWQWWCWKLWQEHCDALDWWPFSIWQYDHNHKSSSLYCLKDLGHNKGQDQYYDYYDNDDDGDDVENYGKNIVMHWTGGLPVCGHNLNSHRSLITLSPHTQDNDLLLYKYTYIHNTNTQITQYKYKFKGCKCEITKC